MLQPLYDSHGKFSVFFSYIAKVRFDFLRKQNDKEQQGNYNNNRNLRIRKKEEAAQYKADQYLCKELQECKNSLKHHDNIRIDASNQLCTAVRKMKKIGLAQIAFQQLIGHSLLIAEGKFVL